jgi:hypothetical protein
MPKIRDILVHVSVEVAQRQRKCRRDTARIIAMGEHCLVVKTNPTNDEYSYSKEHAKPMLDLAWHKLRSIYAEMGLSPPT